MLLMYIGAATSSTKAVVSSTPKDTKGTLVEDIQNISIHDDCTSVITDKPTTDHTYACTENETKINQSEVSNLHADDMNEVSTNVLLEQTTSNEDEDEIARQIAEHVLQHESSVEDELTETVSNHPEMLDLSLPKIPVKEENVTQNVALNLTINCKSDAVKSGLVFVETLNSSKSTTDSIDVSPVITLSKK